MTDMDARTRVRQRLRRLLDDQGKTNRALADWIGHREQWVSNLLAGRFPLSLDELDRVAQFVRVPPSELVRQSDDPWELTPTEMRMVRALRLLPMSVRDHLVILADYLIGVTPEEVDLLTQIRSLTEDEQDGLQNYLRAMRFTAEGKRRK